MDHGFVFKHPNIPQEKLDGLFKAMVLTDEAKAAAMDVVEKGSFSFCIHRFRCCNHAALHTPIRIEGRRNCRMCESV